MSAPQVLLTVLPKHVFKACPVHTLVGGLFPSGSRGPHREYYQELQSVEGDTARDGSWAEGGIDGWGWTAECWVDKWVDG